jgi:hypothetical protein
MSKWRKRLERKTAISNQHGLVNTDLQFISDKFMAGEWEAAAVRLRRLAEIVEAAGDAIDRVHPVEA